MLKKIKLETFETSFTFEIDTEVFTEEHAKSVNEFFIDHKHRLSIFENNVYAAALSLYAADLFRVLVKEQPSIDHFAYWFNLHEPEGYYPMYDSKKEKSHHGIKLIDYNYTFDIPNAEDFEIEEE